MRRDDLVVFDIETIPTQDPALIKHLVETANPPANYKKPESIAKWREENAADIVGKTSFDGGRGHVC